MHCLVLDLWSIFCGNFQGTHLGAPDPSGPLRQRDFAVELKYFC